MWRGGWGNVNTRPCAGTQQEPGTSELPEKHPMGEKEHMGSAEQLVCRRLAGVGVLIWPRSD